LFEHPHPRELYYPQDATPKNNRDLTFLLIFFISIGEVVTLLYVPYPPA